MLSSWLILVAVCSLVDTRLGIVCVDLQMHSILVSLYASLAARAVATVVHIANFLLPACSAQTVNTFLTFCLLVQYHLPCSRVYQYCIVRQIEFGGNQTSVDIMIMLNASAAVPGASTAATTVSADAISIIPSNPEDRVDRTVAIASLCNQTCPAGFYRTALCGGLSPLVCAPLTTCVVGAE